MEADELGGKGWSGTSGDAGAHACHCIGCCRKCGSCRTSPGHTPEMCALIVKQIEERRALSERQGLARTS